MDSAERLFDKDGVITFKGRVNMDGARALKETMKQ